MRPRTRCLVLAALPGLLAGCGDEAPVDAARPDGGSWSRIQTQIFDGGIIFGYWY